MLSVSVVSVRLPGYFYDTGTLKILKNVVYICIYSVERALFWRKICRKNLETLHFFGRIFNFRFVWEKWWMMQVDGWWTSTDDEGRWMSMDLRSIGARGTSPLASCESFLVGFLTSDKKLPALVLNFSVIIIHWCASKQANVQASKQANVQASKQATLLACLLARLLACLHVCLLACTFDCLHANLLPVHICTQCCNCCSVFAFFTPVMQIWALVVCRDRTDVCATGFNFEDVCNMRVFECKIKQINKQTPKLLSTGPAPVHLTSMRRQGWSWIWRKLSLQNRIRGRKSGKTGWIA